MNLLVTHQPNHSEKSVEEVETVLNLVGEEPKVRASPVEGVIYAKVSDSHKAVERLTKLCIADPNLFAYTHHYTPIDTIVPSTIADMKSVLKQLNEKIEGKWQLQLKKRHWDKDGQVIEKLTQPITNGTVDLSKPEQIIRVEIVGEHAAISLIKPHEYLDVKQTKEFG